MTERARRFAAFGQDLHADGGGRQHEPRRRHERDRQGQPVQVTDAGQQGGAHTDLERAQTENVAAQIPQPRRLHLEADDEQKHHHAQFGDMQDRARIGEKAETPRADGEAGREVAEHRSQAEAAENRHRDDPGGQHHDHLDQIAPMRLNRHQYLRSSKFHRYGLAALRATPLQSERKSPKNYAYLPSGSGLGTTWPI